MAKRYAQNKTRSKRDQYTVVLEDLRSQFRVFGEALSHVSDTVDDHSVKLTRMEERLTNLQIEMNFVKEQLAQIRHNQVTRDEFRLLETRVSRLERVKR